MEIINEEIHYQLQGEKGRIDKVLAEIFTGESRSTIQKLIQEEHVLVNGLPVKTNYKTQGDEQISITPIIEEPIPLLAQKIDFDIIYEDHDILVLNKPRGLVVHPAKNHPDQTLMNGLYYYLGENLSYFEGDAVRPGIVHRIDKDTSGLMVVAKNNQSHQYLANQLIDHSMRRKYLALCSGVLDTLEGTIDAPMKRDPNNRIKYRVQKDGKRAITHFKVVEQFEDCALLECQLETGRTHQIRVHLEFIGHPILGDPVYGETPKHLAQILNSEVEGQFLHAYQLELTHPTSHQLMTFTCDLPEYFKQTLEKIRIHS